MKYNFFSDAGHGWLRVPRKELEQLNLLDKISHYSYQRKGNVYLEEDCDLPKFVDAKNKVDEVVEYIPHHSSKSSKIRSYDRFF